MITIYDIINLTEADQEEREQMTNNFRLCEELDKILEPFPNEERIKALQVMLQIYQHRSE